MKKLCKKKNFFLWPNMCSFTLYKCICIQQTFSIIQFLNKTMVWWHIYHVTIIYRMCQCIRDTTENNTFHLTKASSLGTMFTLWPNSIFHWDFLPIEFIGLYRYWLIWKKAHQLYTDNSRCQSTKSTSYNFRILLLCVIINRYYLFC